MKNEMGEGTGVELRLSWVGIDDKVAGGLKGQQGQPGQKNVTGQSHVIHVVHSHVIHP
jgi:hypothetical protein